MQLILVKSYSPSSIEMWLNGKCCRPSEIYCLNLITQAWVKWQMHSYTKACGSFLTKSGFFFILYISLGIYMYHAHYCILISMWLYCKRQKSKCLRFNIPLIYHFLNIKLLFFFGRGWGGRSRNKQPILNNFTKTFVFSKITILEGEKYSKHRNGEYLYWWTL